MPLSQADRETGIGQENNHILAVPDVHWRTWPEIAYRLWSQRRRILRWVILGTLLSGLVATRICKYEGMTQIMPPDNAPSGLASLAIPSLAKTQGISSMGTAGFLGDLLGAKTPGALYARVLASRTIQDDMVRRFDLKRRYWKFTWEDAREELDKRTRIEEDKKSGVLSITVRDRDPLVAAGLAGAYVDELDKVLNLVSTSSARRERVFLDQRLAEEKKTLQDAERQYAQFASSSMALDVPEQTRVMLEAAARVQGELVAAQSELAGLEQIYAPENVRVKSLRARVGQLQAELRKINGDQPTGGGKPDPSQPYPAVKNLPGLGVQWADLYRNTKIHETVYEMLTQEYELARIQEAKEIPRVKVLDEPVIPEKLYPRPWLVLLVGAMVSLVLACTGLLLQDKWYRWDAEDQRRILLANIFAAFSRKS